MSFGSDQSPLPSRTRDEIVSKFRSWNGDGTPPKLSHRMSNGTITVRVATPLATTEVLWNSDHIGYDSIWVDLVLANLTQGNYDRSLGFNISEVIPKNLEHWNDF